MGVWGSVTADAVGAPTLSQRELRQIDPEESNLFLHLTMSVCTVLLCCVFVCILWRMRHRWNLWKKRRKDLWFDEWKHSLHTCCLKCLTIAAAVCLLGDVFNLVCKLCGSAQHILPTTCTLFACAGQVGIHGFAWPLRCFLAFQCEYSGQTSTTFVLQIPKTCDQLQVSSKEISALALAARWKLVSHLPKVVVVCCFRYVWDP